MAAVYSAIVDADNSDYWDGTIAWGYDATSDKITPTAHPNQAARDAQYGARVYNTLSDWEAARDGDAQAGDDEYAIIQGPWDNDDTSDLKVDFSNAVNSYVIKAIGAARVTGVYTTGADAPYRLVAAAPVTGLIILDEANGEVDGIQASNTEEIDTTHAVIINDTAGGSTIVHDCILLDINGRGIEFIDSSIIAQAWNNIVQGSGGREGIKVDEVDTCVLYNNTIHNFDDGIEIDAANSIIIKNNIIFDNGDDIDDAVGATIDYNATDDGDGDHPQGPSGADWANEMSNYAAEDFELDAFGNCYANGVTDPGSGLFSDDVRGISRTVPWSIGAFELDAAGGVAPTGTFFGPLGGPFRGVL